MEAKLLSRLDWYCISKDIGHGAISQAIPQFHVEPELSVGPCLQFSFHFSCGLLKKISGQFRSAEVPA